MSSDIITIDGVKYRELDFIGYPNYRVDSNGIVCSRRELQYGRRPFNWIISDNWHEIGSIKSDSGYVVVFLYCGSKRKRFYVHNLVLEAFVGPRPNGYEACHFPIQDRADNRLENLRWDTQSSNNNDRVYHGTSNRGSRHGMHKLIETDVLEIRRLCSEGLSYEAVAEIFNVSKCTIRDIYARRRWKWL